MLIDSCIMNSNIAREFDPSGPPSRESRHPCISCQRHKVKCDRKVPCTRCLKYGHGCIQPETRRAPRRPRKLDQIAVSEKLRQLEKSFDEVKAAVQRGEHLSQNKPASDCSEKSYDGLEDTLGKLLTDDDKSRYVSGSSWANLTDQISDLRTLLDDDQPAESGLRSDSNTDSTSLTGILPFTSLESREVPQRHLRVLWATYVRNVDPVMKILHVPTMQPIIDNAIFSLDNAPPKRLCLLSAIKFAAVTSLSDKECLNSFGTARLAMLALLRLEVESTLAKAKYITSQDFTTLQALVIFLICNRRHENKKAMWTLAGTATRLAQSLGLHRDGTLMGLPIFATEMRRRLYWEIRMLDLACAEDSGLVPTYIYGADTQLPLSINDEDINSRAMAWPTPRSGFTEMTFALIRFEICNRAHGFHTSAGRASMGIFTGDTSQVGEQTKALEQCKSFIENEYLNKCSPSLPLQRHALKIGQIMLAKLLLIAQYPLFRSSSHSSQAISRADLLDKSCNIIEWSTDLINDKQTSAWSWLLQTYVHWHPVAFLLDELSTNPGNTESPRLWQAIDSALSSHHGLSLEANYDIWRPLLGLFERAKAARQSAYGNIEPVNLSRLYFPPVSETPLEQNFLGSQILPDFSRDTMSIAFDDSFPGFDLQYNAMPTMDDFMSGDIPPYQV